MRLLLKKWNLLGLKLSEDVFGLLGGIEESVWCELGEKWMEGNYYDGVFGDCKGIARKVLLVGWMLVRRWRLWIWFFYPL